MTLSMMKGAAEASVSHTQRGLYYECSYPSSCNTQSESHYDNDTSWSSGTYFSETGGPTVANTTALSTTAFQVSDDFRDDGTSCLYQVSSPKPRRLGGLHPSTYPR